MYSFDGEFMAFVSSVSFFWIVFLPTGLPMSYWSSKYV